MPLPTTGSQGFKLSHTVHKLDSGDVTKTIFRTHYEHSEFLVMSFGLTDAPASSNYSFRKLDQISPITLLKSHDSMVAIPLKSNQTNDK